MKIQFTNDLKITNLNHLPAGLNCKYLLCIRGEDDVLIAKQWCRKEPVPKKHEILVEFK